MTPSRNQAEFPYRPFPVLRTCGKAARFVRTERPNVQNVRTRAALSPRIRLVHRTVGQFAEKVVDDAALFRSVKVLLENPLSSLYR